MPINKTTQDHFVATYYEFFIIGLILFGGNLAIEDMVNYKTMVLLV